MRRLYVKWLLAGYAVAPLLLYAIDHGTQREPVALLLAMVPIMWILAPLGLIVAIVGMWSGIGSEWGPWDGRLVLMGLAAGFVVLAPAGRFLLDGTDLWLENRNPVPNGGDDTLRVPTAQVVRARRAYPLATVMRSQLIGRLATVAWNQLIGRILLASAGASLFFLGAIGLGVAGEGC